MRLALRTCLVLSLALTAACGDDDVTPPPPDLGAVDMDLMVPPGSCAQRGDVGNDIGIGTFCTPTGRECRAFPLAGLCIVSVAPAEGQWFCTRLCERDDQCGLDARCVGDMRGKSCVPSRCLTPEVDGGADSDAGGTVDAAVATDAGVSVDAGGDAG